MSSQPPRRSIPFVGWLVLAFGFAVVGGLVAWVSLLRTAERAPAAAVREGREIVRELGALARAFHEGTVTRLFLSHATALEGTTYLQVATLEQIEVFELRDEASTLWGALDLPAVAVRATAPVTTTYYVDLAGDWQFDLQGHRVLVQAPDLSFNKPAIDASRIEYEVREGSLLRDEDVVLAQLKRELTGRAAIQARAHVDLIRDTARQQVTEYVRNWLLLSYGDADAYRIDIVFADEEAAREPESSTIVKPVSSPRQ